MEKITKKQVDEILINDAINHSVMKERIYKRLGMMLTTELREVYNFVFEIQQPTAEDIVLEVCGE